MSLSLVWVEIGGFIITILLGVAGWVTRSWFAMIFCVFLLIYDYNRGMYTAVLDAIFSP
jgi:hypothetical protein